MKKQEKCFYKHFYKICEESSSWSREKIVNRNRPRPRDGLGIIGYGLHTIVTNILKDTAEKLDKSEQLGNFSRDEIFLGQPNGNDANKYISEIKVSFSGLKNDPRIA